MTHETVQIEKENGGSVHVLAGQITAVNEEEGTVDVVIDGHGSFPDVPVFYHCQHSETADGMPFIDGEPDRVLIVNSGDPVNLSVTDMQVVGYEDGLPRNCPIETVYVLVSGLCFVWDVAQNKYAEIKTNLGDPAVFPCAQSEISDWKDRQTRVGSNLFNDYDCGRGLFTAPELSCGGAGWGTSGSSSDSVSVPSACLSSFDDTGECSLDWDLTMECYPTGGTWWVYAGPSTIAEEQDILWEGVLGEVRSPQKLYFQNNCSTQNAFWVERKYNKNETHWSSDGGGGGPGCFNIRLDAGEYVNNYKIHTPIALNILEINSEYLKSWDMFNDLGAQTQIDCLTELKFVSDGEFSDKTIVQAYTVEARTVERTATCCMNYYGNCQGLGCVLNDCPWQGETFTRHGLEVAAQVGFIPGGTDGVDPTSLPRNTDFESAIKTAYNQVRSDAGLPDDELLELNFSMLIYKGI